MKSVYLVYEFLSEQGGLERELINHARMLKKEGYDVKILTCHFDRNILKQLPFEGIKIETLPVINTKFEIINLGLCALGLHKMKKYNPDAFLIYSFPSNFLVRNKKCKKINYLNHLLHAYHMPLKEKIEWASGTQGVKRWISVLGSLILSDWLNSKDLKLVRKNNLHLVNSNFTKKSIDSHYNIKSIVSYPPLDPKFENPKIKKIDEGFVFSSSRIIPDKKYEWLIEAMSKTTSKLPLYLAGSVNDQYKLKLINLAKSKKVKLKFLGKLNTNEIISYYGSAAVFAFPTPGEDFGLVPAESLACGTPVIAWADGAGPTEQIVDGVTGYLAKPYDIGNFAEKIDEAIKSKIKQKNRNKIIVSAKKFSFSSVQSSFLAEIKKIL